MQSGRFGTRRYFQTRVGTYLGTDPTRSKMVQCLLNADDAHNAERSDEPWPTFYASYLLGLGQGGVVHLARSS